MTRGELVNLLRRTRYVVVATAGPDAKPAAATVGVAVTDRLELVFDTLESTRKAVNLGGSGPIAVVVGSLEPDASRTIQIQGVARRIDGSAAQPLIAQYLEVFPDGRERQNWPGLCYYQIMLEWIRDSNFATTPPTIVEFDRAALDRMG